jgi:hypothetical protein
MMLKYLIFKIIYYYKCFLVYSSSEKLKVLKLCLNLKKEEQQKDIYKTLIVKFCIENLELEFVSP